MIVSTSRCRPGSFLRGGTKIGSDCVIGPSADLLDTTVADGAQVEHSVGRGAVVGEGVGVGPYSFLRPGTVLEAGSKVGAFCEVKNTRGGGGSKVPHLSYVGDAEIGEGANLGAGTITATLKPNVVVLDLRMPGMDGYEVCRLIKSQEDTKSTEVIAMTAFPSPESEKRILDCGARICLEKPLEIQNLLKEIRAAL